MLLGCLKKKKKITTNRQTYKRRPLEETTDEASIENQKEVSSVLSMNSVATSANSDAVETNLIVWNLCAHLSIHN